MAHEFEVGDIVIVGNKIPRTDLHGMVGVVRRIEDAEVGVAVHFENEPDVKGDWRWFKPTSIHPCGARVTNWEIIYNV